MEELLTTFVKEKYIAKQILEYEKQLKWIDVLNELKENNIERAIVQFGKKKIFYRRKNRIIVYTYNNYRQRDYLTIRVRYDGERFKTRTTIYK